jgi:hypothetical protein
MAKPEEPSNQFSKMEGPNIFGVFIFPTNRDCINSLLEMKQGLAYETAFCILASGKTLCQACSQRICPLQQMKKQPVKPLPHAEISKVGG